jgi:hypothetical protein
MVSSRGSVSYYEKGFGDGERQRLEVMSAVRGVGVTQSGVWMDWNIGAKTGKISCG